MRYHIIDGIRGISLISMVIYHMVWDIVYIWGLIGSGINQMGLTFGSKAFVGHLFYSQGFAGIWEEIN